VYKFHLPPAGRRRGRIIGVLAGHDLGNMKDYEKIADIETKGDSPPAREQGTIAPGPRQSERAARNCAAREHSPVSG
jgi:hypothetical protein